MGNGSLASFEATRAVPVVKNLALVGEKWFPNTSCKNCPIPMKPLPWDIVP